MLVGLEYLSNTSKTHQKKREKAQINNVRNKNGALAGMAQWLSSGLQIKGLPVQFPVRHMPGLWARSLLGAAQEATTH